MPASAALRQHQASQRLWCPEAAIKQPPWLWGCHATAACAHRCRAHPEDYLERVSPMDVFAFAELLHHPLHKLQIYLVPILVTPCR